MTIMYEGIEMTLCEFGLAHDFLNKMKTVKSVEDCYCRIEPAECGNLAYVLSHLTKHKANILMRYIRRGSFYDSLRWGPQFSFGGVDKQTTRWVKQLSPYTDEVSVEELTDDELVARLSM